MAKEQQMVSEQAWKTAVEEEKTEKLAQVNKLIERVKGMEVKQNEIRQDMEQKLKNVQEKTQKKYQKRGQTDARGESDEITQTRNTKTYFLKLQQSGNMFLCDCKRG